jgi:hypothetical protein
MYHALTVLYPREFRYSFGEELLETFAEDLAAQQAARGIRGLLTVWRIALSEVIHLAPQLWFRNTSVAVPLFTALAMIATASPALVQAIRCQEQAVLRPGQTSPLDAILALALEGMIAALTASLAVQRLHNQRLICLGSLRGGKDQTCSKSAG